MIVLLLGAVSLASAVPTQDAPTGQAMLKFEFIFDTAPFASCHASTIAETDDGLIAAWFGGTTEGKPDVGIWVSRHTGGKWDAPVEVAGGRQADGTLWPCWNPVLFQPRTGPLLLFYKVGPAPWTNWWGMLIESSDGGKTWSAPRRLPEGILGPIKNKPVQLADGTILCPSSIETDGWRVHFERSTDNGKTWSSTGPVNDGKTIAAIQPSILVHTPSRLQAIGRTKQKRVFTVDSEDSGKTWGPMTLTDLPNPNSGTDAVTLRNGRFLLVYNPTTKDRNLLAVAISRDGKTWTRATILENGSGEFSYPAVIQTRDGLVHITYTWNRTHIKHVVLDPARLDSVST